MDERVAVPLTAEGMRVQSGDEGYKSVLFAHFSLLSHGQPATHQTQPPLSTCDQ